MPDLDSNTPSFEDVEHFLGVSLQFSKSKGFLKVAMDVIAHNSKPNFTFPLFV